MEEIRQIIEELESTDFISVQADGIDSFVLWWNAQICAFGSVSIADLLDFLKSLMLIDDMEIKFVYHRWGFTEGLVETKNFIPHKGITGKWFFTPKFPELKPL